MSYLEARVGDAHPSIAPTRWQPVGVLDDILTVLTDNEWAVCRVEGTTICWDMWTPRPADDTAWAEKVKEVEARAEYPFRDAGVDWASALLAEHLSEADMFLLALAAPISRHTTHATKTDTGEETNFDITIRWTEPRQVSIVRRITVNPIASGSGKAHLMAITVMQARRAGQQVTII